LGDSTRIRSHETEEGSEVAGCEFLDEGESRGNGVDVEVRVEGCEQ
jgi:hypothetical protein